MSVSSALRHEIATFSNSEVAFSPIFSNENRFHTPFKAPFIIAAINVMSGDQLSGHEALIVPSRFINVESKELDSFVNLTCIAIFHTKIIKMTSVLVPHNVILSLENSQIATWLHFLV